MFSQYLPQLKPLTQQLNQLGFPAEEAAWICWNYLLEPGEETLSPLFAANDPQAAFLALDHIYQLDKEELGKYDIKPAVLNRLQAKEISPESIKYLAIFLQQKGQILTPAHAAWPNQLTDLGPAKPHALWVKGKAKNEILNRSAISIVGARASTRVGEDIASSWAAHIARKHIPVISGGAYGIDAAAHRGALSTGETIAVMAGGIDRLYPAGNLELLERISNRGLIVAENPPGSAPTRWRFLSRNRLIAALGSACVIVEAGWRSGALATIRRALEIGRPVGAVPGSINSVSSMGCLGAIRDLNAKLLITPEDVLQLLPQALTLFGVNELPEATGDQPQLDSTVELELATVDPSARRIYEAVPKLSKISRSELTQQTGLSEIEVLTGVGNLELLGLVQSQGEFVRRQQKQKL